MIRRRTEIFAFIFLKNEAFNYPLVEGWRGYSDILRSSSTYLDNLSLWQISWAIEFQ